MFAEETLLRVLLTLVSAVLLWIGGDALWKGQIRLGYKSAKVNNLLMFGGKSVIRHGLFARLYALVPTSLGLLGLYEAWF